MKKTLVFGFALAFSITPLSAFAAVNSINGLTAAHQSLVSPNSGATNTMHMDIITVGTDTHRFKWDGTPWRVDQGGTGWANFTAGALIYGNGSSGLATTTPATSGQILQFNGSFPTWVSTSSLGIVAQAAGADGEIQFNNAGVFGADARIKWSPDFSGTGALIVPAILGTNSTEGVNAARIRFDVQPPEATYFRGSTIHAQGADVSVADETIYSDGLYSGGVELEGGGLSSANGAAGAAGIYISPAEWHTGTGWKGGDVEIFSGVVAGGSPATHGSIFMVGPVSFSQGPFSFDGNITLGNATLDVAALTSAHNLSFPDASGTFGLLEVDQTWTGNNTFSKGAGTTTVTFGTPGDATSHVCFNTKNTNGADISFYFVGTSMVVENNACQ